MSIRDTPFLTVRFLVSCFWTPAFSIPDEEPLPSQADLRAKMDLQQREAMEATQARIHEEFSKKYEDWRTEQRPRQSLESSGPSPRCRPKMAEWNTHRTAKHLTSAAAFDRSGTDGFGSSRVFF